MDEDCQFLKDLTYTETEPINAMNRGWYNLILSVRDVSMYARHKIKPHRFWKISDVKKYFGIKGHARSIEKQLRTLKAIVEETSDRQKKEK